VLGHRSAVENLGDGLGGEVWLLDGAENDSWDGAFADWDGDDDARFKR